MKETNKKKQIAKISIFITSIFVILLSVTYAFMTEILIGTKKVTIAAGTLSLVLDEGNAITISDGLPMYDAVGMIQEEVFTFDLINETSNPTAYTLKLQKVATANELSTSDVKYYLTKDGVGIGPNYLSSLGGEGQTVGDAIQDQALKICKMTHPNEKIETLDDCLDGFGSVYEFMLSLPRSYVVYPADLGWAACNDEGFTTESECVSDVSEVLPSISSYEDLGKYYYQQIWGYIPNTSSVEESASSFCERLEALTGSDCITAISTAAGNNFSTIEEATNFMLENGCIPEEISIGFDGIIDQGTIAGNQTIEYTLRLWIRDGVTDITAIQGKSLSYKLNVEAGQEGATTTPTIPTTVTFAGITESVNTTTEETMFNYTSEGVSPLGGEAVAATNGIYAMEDDDALSYYYRGEVNNLVKFGSYTKDYYVYRYSNYDFPSLEACQYYSSSCSEADKVLKYAASDSVPMYWRIVRVNGDGTIRMIYAGTTPDATGYDTGIGISRYNEECDNPKYAGYTYDNTTSKTNSDAKTEIDNWYKNVFEGTEYDSDIATGKFCSDSSGYEYDSIATEMMGADAYTFEGFRRNYANMYGTGNSSPSFKCTSEVDANIGGSYNLKAGLITLDEIIAAGGQAAENNSYYLYNGTKGNNDGKWFWSMSPAEFNYGGANVGGVNTDGFAGSDHVNIDEGLLRPVINLRSNVTFKSGTNGSTTSPYEIN